MFYIPAGRVHAICSGVLLAEVQQSSDVTYRIYDYNRVGLDGKPRELHTELAAQALSYQVEDEYRTEYSTEENRANRVVESPFFSVRVTELEETFHRNLVKYDSFIITMCLKGDCRIRIRSTQEEVVLKEGFSCLIPAAIADYDVIPVSGRTKVLDAFIDNMDRSLGGGLRGSYTSLLEQNGTNLFFFWWKRGLSPFPHFCMVGYRASDSSDEMSYRRLTELGGLVTSFFVFNILRAGCWRCRDFVYICVWW